MALVVLPTAFTPVWENGHLGAEMTNINICGPLSFSLNCVYFPQMVISGFQSDIDKSLGKQIVCFMTLFRSMIVFCGVDSIPQNILEYSHIRRNVGLFRDIQWNTVNPTKYCYGYE